ncbi:hypothetical protein A9404_01335 [Halothiobacillus diazotrophicus]|uniref:GtrA/DPMS transmembrane domain-containing protein n=1 Tax=Halothiobacillus diazotrophicus TaxID=1860122 RepID=A0A191ZEA5_9GAMM|nr:GtrA family protein [Halothiobacillus diazotrophicus]ANJ66195.1 hypothetical protein A9404_01335 [Halothiobacillus diazotrophicus]
MAPERVLGLLRTGQSLFFFGLVGLTAAGVHLAVVWVLVSQTGMAALLANPAGFFVAFWVSFFGHRHASFAREEPHPIRQALPRFALVAVLAFLANEFLYALLLAFTPLPYTVALFLVILVVAVGTYLASRLWAFPLD